MPAPACTLGREGEILLLWKSWGGGGPHQRCKKRGAGFPLRQRWSCCCPGRGREQPRPPPRAGRTVPPQLGAACTAGHTDVARCLPLL